MNRILYIQYQQYLESQTVPEHFKEEERRKFLSESQKFTIKLNRIYKNRKDDTKVKVLKEGEIDSILFMLHNHDLAGHFGEGSTLSRIKNRFWWPNMKNDVKEYVKSCDVCQRRGNTKIPGPLNPIKVGKPFERIGIDIIGPLPPTAKKNRYIVTAIDYLTKWPEAKALKEANAENVAQFIFDDIICRHGCPKIILSDRGTHFVNQVVDKLCERFDINHQLSSPYHPQTNGLVERFNRTLSETLAKLTRKENQWDNYISAALFAYRTNQHGTTKFSPFMLTYGQEAILPIDDTNTEENSEEINILNRMYQIINVLEDNREVALENIEKSQIQRKKRFDQKLKNEKKFNIGDKVLLKDSAKEKQWSGKLLDKWKGPYYIHAIIGKGAYKLQTIENNKVLKTPFNVINLKLYVDKLDWEPKIYL